MGLIRTCIVTGTYSIKLRRKATRRLICSCPVTYADSPWLTAPCRVNRRIRVESGNIVSFMGKS